MAIENNLLIYKYNYNLLLIHTETDENSIIPTKDLFANQRILTARLLNLNSPKFSNLYHCKIIKFQKSLNCFFIDLGNNYYALLKNNKQTDNILNNPSIGKKFIANLTKEGNSTKYPLVSPKIILKGLLCDFDPLGNKIDFCPQLNLNAKEKEKIKNIISSNFANHFRVIIKQPLLPELLQEIKIKTQFWNQIITKKYNKLGIINSYIVVDYLFENFANLPKNIVTNSLTLLKQIKEEINTFLPFTSINTIYHNSGEIFLHYLNELEETISNKYIINDNLTLHIFNTQALTFIDIDFKGLNNLNKDKAFFQANILAVNSIVRLIKLRNLSGQIFIDTLKMNNYSNKLKLLDIYSETFKKFNVAVNIMGFTKLGILEIERTKKYNSLNESLFTECIHCNGSGQLIKKNLIFIKTILQINTILTKNPVANITIKGNQSILELFKQYHPELLTNLKVNTINFIIDNSINNAIIVY